jgi:alkylation response protein AidB-like acyl-CoA dehydrogenase
MDLPGIEVRPLVTAHGTAEFAELFLDEVRIPVANRVGDENDGWRVTNVTLSFERGTAFIPDMLQSFSLLRELAKLAPPDPGVQRELGHLGADLDGLWALTKRNVSQAARTGIPGVGGSVFKLHYTETRHRMGALAMRILGSGATTLHDEHVRGQMQAISYGIAAGTSQIQRNIVAERVLGLPKEPRG